MSDNTLFSKKVEINQSKHKNRNQWTGVVFGEMGQGKSTTLNSLVKLAEEMYFKGYSHDC